MSNYGWLKTLLMFVIAFAVQSTIGDWLKILGVGPDFILIFIVSVALRFGAGVAASGDFWRGSRWMSMRRWNGWVPIPLP